MQVNPFAKIRRHPFAWLAAILVLSWMPALIQQGPHFLKPVFFGWLTFIARVFPRLKIHWGEWMVTAIEAALLILGSHMFVRWVRRQRGDPRWKIRWTLAGSAVIFLLFLSAMSVMGVAHQTAWLIHSPMRLTERRADSGCLSNMRQIGLALLLYANENGGHYPPDLSTLLLNDQMSPWVFVCPSSDDEAGDDATTQRAAADLKLPHHCSYIYLGKGLKWSVPASQVILVEPPGNHAGDGMNVLYGDGHAAWVDRAHAAAIFEKYGLAD
jgi:prepilin-type processing-associated H-X9-DG protein